MFRNLMSLTSAIIVTWCYIPYAKDIISGKAKPARSARIMLTILIIIALLQQRSLNAGWTMAVTAGETVGSLAILILAVSKGVGGFKRIDILCYALLCVDLALWLSTKQTLLALHLTIIADTIAVYPTLIKTWHDPQSETPLFFMVGTLAPLINILAVRQYTYAILVFPLYLVVINGLVVALIYKRTPTASDAILTK